MNIINELRNNYFGTINKDYIIKCDDGNGPYDRKYEFG